MARDARPLEGRTILVVEDDYMIASVLIDVLEDAGARVVGPLSYVQEAVDFIERGDARLDGAVLDVNLHGERSYPIADRLIARGIHLVFVTGYDSLEAAYRSYPRCQKPFEGEALISALAG
jgi:CheY-like chemotaxis protein